MKDGAWQTEVDRKLLRAAREERSLTRSILADRLGVTAQSIYNWEQGKSDPQANNLQALINEFGAGAFAEKQRVARQELSESFGTWVLEQRTKRKWSRPELARRANLTPPTIWNIETGRTTSPQQSTLDALEGAFGEQIPEDVEAEIAEAAEVPVEGVGDFLDFDPHDESQLPQVAGVYVFYDISERAIYVGESGDIAKRIRDPHTGHWNKFWYRPPIVQSASYVRIEDATLRHQIEVVLIKFLKSNAVLNQQSVDR